MTKLTDTQSILLSTASQREGGSLLPLPSCLKPGGGVTKAVDALIRAGLVEERETSEAAAVRRTDGDLGYGVFITAAGLTAIGAGEPDGGDGGGNFTVPLAPAPGAKPPSKAAAVLDLLCRAEGATTAELIEATGWLPHTTRAALTGFRKKGHAVERSKRGDTTCYRIVGAA